MNSRCRTVSRSIRMRANSVAIGLALTVAGPSVAQTAAQVDPLFAKWNSDTAPGCVIAVERDGKPVMTRAYGMADLEHGIRNTPGTVFEAGSVSKQFTAAAVLALVEAGKLSLETDVRTLIPELPDYGHVIPLDRLLNHTSGLRDWGGILGLAGWPRTTRAPSHASACTAAPSGEPPSAPRG